MNVVFLNTFEIEVDEGTSKSAQLSIADDEGVWQVVWSETNETEEQEQEQWYLGNSWEELILVLRIQLLHKTSLGYRSLIPIDLNNRSEEHHKFQFTSKLKQAKLLDYYSTLYPNPEVYEELRNWRRSKAIEESKAPYMLATNQILRMVSVFLPQNLQELRQIPGCGRQKTNHYAEEMLRITSKNERKTVFPLDWVNEQVNMETFYEWLNEQKQRKNQYEQEKEAKKRKLIEMIHVGESIESMVTHLVLSRRDLLLWIEELDREGYNLLPLANLELREIPSEHQEKAWAFFEKEGTRYLKPVLTYLTEQEGLHFPEIDRAYDWLRLLRIKFIRSPR